MATSLALGPSEPLRVLRQHCVVCKYQDLTTAGRSRKCEWLVFWNDQSLSFYRRARSLDNCQLFVGAFVFLLGVWFWLSCSSFCPEVTPRILRKPGHVEHVQAEPKRRRREKLHAPLTLCLLPG